MAPKYEVSTIIPTQETGYSAARALGLVVYKTEVSLP